MTTHDHPEAMGRAMARDIAEQPTCLQAILDVPPPLPPALVAAAMARPIVLVLACGSSMHAAELVRPAAIGIANIGWQVQPAHELAALGPAALAHVGLCISISQSGQTHDTCVAQQLAHEVRCPTLAIVGLPDGPLAAAATWSVASGAGAEGAVPSTKGFVAQACRALQLVAAVAQARPQAFGALHAAGAEAATALTAGLRALPDRVATLLAQLGRAGAQHATLGAAADLLAGARQVVLLGAGAGAATAKEGALKLQEAAYLPAGGWAVGEFKHGPQAMLTPEDVAVVVLPFEASQAVALALGRMQRAGVRVVAIGPDNGAMHAQAAQDGALVLHTPARAAGQPDAAMAPLDALLAAVVLQHLALQAARARGIDADAPRALVKSIAEA